MASIIIATIILLASIMRQVHGFVTTVLVPSRRSPGRVSSLAWLYFPAIVPYVCCLRSGRQDFSCSVVVFRILPYLHVIHRMSECALPCALQTLDTFRKGSLGAAIYPRPRKIETSGGDLWRLYILDWNSVDHTTRASRV